MKTTRKSLAKRGVFVPENKPAPAPEEKKNVRTMDDDVRRDKAVINALQDNKRAIESIGKIVQQQGEMISRLPKGNTAKKWDVQIHRDADGSITRLTMTNTSEE